MQGSDEGVGRYDFEDVKSKRSVLLAVAIDTFNDEP
jgi:hypothetical protein